MDNNIKRKVIIKNKLCITKAIAFNAGFPASVREVVMSGLTKTKRLFNTLIKRLSTSRTCLKQIEY